jgi:hypothetical protein
MNFKTTLVLLLLAVFVGAWLWLRPPLPSWLDPAPKPPPVADHGTRAELTHLGASSLKRIEIHHGQRSTILERTRDGWNMPGNWNVRSAEADALARTLTSLHSRFEPEAINGQTSLMDKGLDPPTLQVDLETADKKYHLDLGEAPANSQTDPFARPTYLRLDKRDEVVRLGPGLIAQLDRPAEYYQQRRLFPADRIAKDDDSGEKVERLAALEVTADRTTDKKDVLDLETPGKSTEKKPEKEHFRLVRKGDAWEMKEPAVDRLDSRTRDALLAAVPDVWAETFLHGEAEAAALVACGARPDPATALCAAWWATDKGLLDKAGLDAPTRTLTVRRNDDKPVTLLIGRTYATHERKMPGNPQTGQRDTTVEDKYLYAKLQDNGQLFAIQENKLRDVFVSPGTLREAQVAPFSSADAQKLEISHGSGKIVLEKDKERWRLVEPLHADADAGKVTDLLSKLTALQARDKDVLDNADPKKYGFDSSAPVLVVHFLEETKEKDAKGDKIKKPRVLTVHVGKHDTAAKKLYVMADEWPRINVVDDSLDSPVRQDALAYRGKRVLDFAAPYLARLEVQRGSEKYTLERSGDGWRLTSPVTTEADTDKANDLATKLSTLEVLEFVNDTPKAEELGPQYGLDKQALSVRLEFGDKNRAPTTLQIGKARTGKPGYFARLVESPDRMTPVVAIAKDVHDALDRDSLAYRRPQLWQLLPQDVTAVRIRRAKEDEYRLVREGLGWKIAAPFEAPAQLPLAQTLVQNLTAPQAQSYKVHEAKDLTPYGLDKPSLTVTVTAQGGKEHTLLVGAPAGKDGPGHYAKLASSPAVFVVSDTVARAADQSAVGLLDPALLHIGEDQIARVQAKVGDKTLTLERQADGWKVVEGPGTPFAADADAVTSLANLLGNLHAERFAAYGSSVDWKKYGLDKPTATLTVSLKASGNPATHTIELGAAVESSPGSRYVRVDKGAGVAVLGAGAAEVLARTHLDYVNRHLLQFDAGAAQALVRQQGTDLVEVVKKDGSWRLTKPADERADDETLQQLLGQLGDLRARRIAAYPAGDLASFGLDKPVVVTIKLPGAKPAEHVIKLGKAISSSGGERFALVDNGPAVGVLPGDLADRLTAGAVAFRNRDLTNLPDADKVVLERGPRKAVFSKPEGTWKLTEPLEAPAEHDELQGFVDSLAKLRADALVAEKPGPEQLHKFGLDKPEAHWKLIAGDKEVLHLIIGGAEEHGARRYARLAGRDVVFLLDPRLSARALGEFRTRSVWEPAPDAAQVDALRYSWTRNPFTLDKGESGTWQVAGKPDARVNTEAVNDTLAALSRLKLVRYVVDQGANLELYGLDKPELVLEVVSKGGNRRVLEVGAVPEGTHSRYARVPGSAKSDVFLLDEADCARLLRRLTDFTGPRPIPPTGS